ITSVRDARITEQAFQIILRQGSEIAISNCEQRNKPEQPLHVGQHQKRLKHAQQNNEACGFRSNGKKRCHRRWRTLINIRHPDLEWHGGNFESESDEYEHRAEGCPVTVDLASSECGRDSFQIRVASYAKDPGDAVNKKRSRKRAEN